MKLNPDCVRDTLLYLEEHLTINCLESTFNSITLAQLTEEMLKKYNDKYTENDIWYTIYNLHQIRFIDGNISNAADHKMIICEIENITWNGHQFLNNVRPKTVWDATKAGASKLGIMSINALSTIAMKVTEAVITNPVVINKIIEQIQ